MRRHPVVIAPCGGRCDHWGMDGSLCKEPSAGEAGLSSQAAQADPCPDPHLSGLGGDRPRGMRLKAGRHLGQAA